MEPIYQIPQKFSDDVEQKNFWLKLIVDQKASGLSIKKFCEQHQISFSTFSYWKYRKNKPGSSVNNNISISKAKNKQADKDIAKFIPIQVTTGVPPARNHQEAVVDCRDRKIEIAFKNGHKIILPLVISDTNLLLFIKAVGEL
jgi:hypothetical protein